jgi:hypothetical protein
MFLAISMVVDLRVTVVPARIIDQMFGLISPYDVRREV